ncbi:sucrose phosphorylase [Halobacillus alkaliphilus]|uniref:Sucrose phosphorylase n=1 Tax=Halobacillus alkaliphilus TaxID=396056 RepID=A0A1I2L1L7_9BACI|nr:sugar phosphorylase [Halobacillus alkaliphilus]SFF73174.1 sucrose phosphorylase [Halobacillus alkaliphilus]
MSQNSIDTIKQNLYKVYGDEKGSRILKAIYKLIDQYKQGTQPKEWVDEKDVMLITYGDSVKNSTQKPLHTLKEFLNEYVGDTINSVHILPFYPYTSDDGFSVQDYLKVDPELGNWEQIHKLAEDYDLMFDAVINHISSKSDWFLKYLKGDPSYQDYFVESDPSLDHSSIVRPRALPLLTEVEHAEGTKYVWTTFSEDQIDLNYESEALFLEVLEILAQYVQHGARYLRLDAIGFLWKRLNTTSIHLDETHRIVQVMRDVLEEISPGTIIITETNVPHKDNISYFGDGSNEAHMVYQFPLPPLTLNAFLSGNAKHLSEWADSLEPTSEHTSFFNFLASHDGVGLRPVVGILEEAEVQKMAERVKRNGGYVSYKDNGDGTKSPYELNINYLSALKKEDDTQQKTVDRFIAAQSILLSVKGVPGIYIHSILGSENDQKGVEATGRNRSINREKLFVEDLEQELKKDGSLRERIFNRFMDRIEKRKAEIAFHPNADQKVLFLDDRLFTIVRTHEETEEKLVAIINVSEQQLEVSTDSLKEELGNKALIDVISESNYPSELSTLTVEPYQALWLKEA